jgi:hypothetical protein
MRIWPILLGTAALLSPGLAGATTVFDSVDINPAAFNSGAQATNTSWDWVDPTANGPLGSEFSVSSPQTLSSVSLELSAELPTDGGSIVVTLLPDNGGSPAFTTTAGVSTFTGGTVIGTIADATLSTNSALVTLSADVDLTPGSYWIGLETPPTATSGPDAYGSGQWWWSQPDPSNPLTNNFNSIGGAGPFVVGGSVSNPGDYELIVTTPEPASIAILGASLAGLGYFRRRKSAKA